MTMPFSGQISLGDARTELSADYAPTSQITLNDTAVRTLFERSVASTNIQLSDGYGKSNRKSLPVIASTQTNLSINVSTLSGYVAGKSDITITINGGTIISSTSTGSPALTIFGAVAGDTVTLINNGTIVGRGGRGGNGGGGSNDPGPTAGEGGGTAISLGCGLVITNNGTIGGGGGGGGGGSAYSGARNVSTGGGGGGGAGYGTGGTTGGGTGGATTGGGGGSNGSVGGTGGGLGASGSTGGSATFRSFIQVITATGREGGVGGKAIALNGYGVSRSGSGTTYGAVS
jgi:hypothetical protein